MKSLLSLFALMLSLLAQASFAAEELQLLSYDQAAMAHNKANLNPESLAFLELIRLADKALKAPINPVTEKTLMPASGNPQDYYSFGPYWWPNPDTKDGLPYIRRDGLYNPATRGSATDKQRLIRFTHDVLDLSLAYYFTDNVAYADKAVEQLRAWLINPETRMAPHMKYAQAIPGMVDGQALGIIESRKFIRVLKALPLLRSKLSDEEYKAIQDWFTEFTYWLTNSPNGKEEGKFYNNHSTWYDAQIVAYSIFIGKKEQAIKHLKEITATRVAEHFNNIGMQPHELARTRPWHYSNFNLEAYTYLADFGEKLGVDLWRHQDGGVTLKNGYSFVARYVINPKTWPFRDLKGFQPHKAYTSILYANRALSEPIFDQAIQILKDDRKAQKNVHNLLFKLP